MWGPLGPVGPPLLLLALLPLPPCMLWKGLLSEGPEFIQGGRF